MPSRIVSRSMELVSLVFLLLILYPLLGYASLEGVPVPMHFDIKGNVDAWSSRESLILVSLIGVAIYGLLSFCQRHPRLVNLPRLGSPVSTEERNQIARSYVLMLKAWLMVLFGFISISTYRIAIGEEQKLNVIFLCGIIFCLLASIVILLMAFRKKTDPESRKAA